MTDSLILILSTISLAGLATFSAMTQKQQIRPRAALRVVSVFMAAAVFFSSCKESNPEDGKLPTVSFEVKNIGERTITLSVTSSNATVCAVMAVEEGQDIPAAQDVIGTGTPVEPGEDVEVEISGLLSEKFYTILAVSSDGENYSKTEQKTIRTTGYDPQADYILKATSSGGTYYGPEGNGCGAYSISFSDVEFNEAGWAVSGGLGLNLDIYGEYPEVAQFAVLPDGVYVIDTDSSLDPGTITADYSYMTIVGDDGYPVGDNLMFTSGQITSSYDESSRAYMIDGFFTIENGKTLAFRYEGGIEFANQSGGLGMDIDMTDGDIAGAIYYGNTDNNNIGNYYLAMRNYDLNEDGSIAGHGFLVMFDFYAALSGDSNNAVLPDGSYSFEYGNKPGTLGAEMTFYYFLEGEYKQQGEFTGGTINVTSSGGMYTISGELEMADGHKLICDYKGPITFENQEVLPVGSVENARFTRAEGIYYPEYEQNAGFESYFITLVEETTGIRTRFELRNTLSEDQSDPVLPSGTYTAANYTDPYKAMTVVRGEKTMNFYYDGSWCRRENYNTGFTSELPMKDGSVKLENLGNDQFRIEVDFVTDDGPFTGTYEGTMLFYSGEIPEPVGNLDIETRHVFAAKYFGVDGNPAGALNYNFEVSDVEFKADGMKVVPVNGGPAHMFVFDLYTPAGSGRLTEGTYRLSGTSEAMTANWSYTFVKVFDRFTAETDVVFQNGEVTVKDDGTNYDITLTAYSARNEEIKCRYYGPIEFQDRSKSLKSESKRSYLPLLEDADISVRRFLTEPQASTVEKLRDQFLWQGTANGNMPLRYSIRPSTIHRGLTR